MGDVVTVFIDATIVLKQDEASLTSGSGIKHMISGADPLTSLVSAYMVKANF